MGRFNFRIRKPKELPKKKSKAERVKEYRDRLKNSEYYGEFLEKDRQRANAYRQNRTQEQKDRDRENSKLRSKKYRDRLKEKHGTTVPLSRQTHVKTRKEVAIQRTYWCEKKKESRERCNVQKRRRIKEYDRKRKREEVLDDNKSVETGKNEKSDGFKLKMNFTSPSAERKAVSRAKSGMPEDSNKYASVVLGLIQRASPKKKEALKEKGITTRLPTGINLKSAIVKRIVAKLKRNRNKSAKQFTRKFVHLIQPSYKSLNNMSKELGLRYQYLHKICKLKEDDCESVWEARKDKVPDNTINKVQDFYIKPSTSVALPDVKKVRKGISCFSLEKTLKGTFKDFRKTETKVKIGFSKFCSLRPRNVRTFANTPLRACICEYCANLELKIKVLKRKIPNLGDKYEAVNATLCPMQEGEQFHEKSCIYRECDSCGIRKLERILQIVANDKSIYQWYKWDTVVRPLAQGNGNHKKKGLVTVTGSGNDIVTEFNRDLEHMSLHLFTATWQHRQFSEILTRLAADMVVMVLDFGKNYNCFYQDEAQSAHWAADQVTIHPIVTYYLCRSCSSVTKEDIVVLSGDLKHDNFAVDAFTKKAIEHLTSTRGVKINKLIQFSDGCAGQYKSKNAFKDILMLQNEYGFEIQRNYFGSRHGKGPSDSCTGVVKAAVARAVKSRQAIVSCPQEMYQLCLEKLTKDVDDDCSHSLRTFFLVNDIDRKQDIEVSSVPGTRKLHSVRATAEPMHIKARNLTCCCDTCLNERKSNCKHRSYVDDWRQFQLVKPSKVSSLGRRKGEKLSEAQEGSARKVKKTKEDKIIPSADSTKLDDHAKQPILCSEQEAKKKNNDLTERQTDIQLLLDSESTQMDRKIFFRNIQREFASAETFDQLKMIVSHFAAEIDARCYPELQVLSQTITDLPVIIDLDACTMVPDDLPNQYSRKYPVVIYGDGNCLPRSASVLSFGHEDFHDEIRVRIVIELVNNEATYLSCSFLSLGQNMDRKKVEKLSMQYAMYSPLYVPGEKLSYTVIQRIFEGETLEVAKPSVFMGIWQMFAVASILKSKLYSVYPKLGNKNVREDLHRLIMPRGCEPKYSVAIMWTSNRDDMNKRHWIPNHFVPLIPLGEVDTIELSDNFGFETSTIFQEMETEAVPTDNLQAMEIKEEALRLMRDNSALLEDVTNQTVNTTRLLNDGNEQQNEPISTQEPKHKDFARFDVGTFICVQHGRNVLPAVVAEKCRGCLWIQYFKPERNRRYSLHDKKFTVILTDIVKKLNPPDITPAGSRVFYSFKDL